MNERIFICPKCDTNNNYSENAHTIICKKCGRKYYKQQNSENLIRVKSQLVRKYPK